MPANYIDIRETGGDPATAVKRAIEGALIHSGEMTILMTESQRVAFAAMQVDVVVQLAPAKEDEAAPPEKIVRVSQLGVFEKTEPRDPRAEPTPEVKRTEVIVVENHAVATITFDVREDRKEDVLEAEPVEDPRDGEEVTEPDVVVEPTEEPVVP
jgi:hypothetical protein